MKHSNLLAAVGGVSLLLSGCGKQAETPVANQAPAPAIPPALLSWHFAGANALQNNSELKTLNGVISAPESKPIFQLFAKKLALSVFSAGPTNQVIAEKIAPLVGDLASNESAFELRSGGQWTLALKADSAAAARWSTNLWVAKASLGAQPLAGASGSWMVKPQGSLPGFSFSTSADSIVVSAGPASAQEIASVESALKQAKSSPAGDWLTGEVDHTLLQWLGPVAPGRAKFSASGKSDSVRWDSTLTFSQPLSVKPGVPHIPAQTAHDPLTGFTLVRGGWKGLEPLFKMAAIPTVPEEFVLWGEQLTAFTFSLAFPSPNPTAYVAAFATNVVPALNAKAVQTAMGKIIYRESENRVIWSDVLPTVPFLTIGKDKDAGFVVGGLFPTTTTPKTKSMPAELVSEMTSRTNLVYYDWEITQLRLAQLRPTHQFISILRGIPFNEKDSISEKWFEAIQPRLGNAITEGTLVAPNQLHFVRRSHIGLGSYELLALATWLDIPKPIVRGTHPKPAKAPATVPKK